MYNGKGYFFGGGMLAGPSPGFSSMEAKNQEGPKTCWGAHF